MTEINSETNQQRFLRQVEAVIPTNESLVNVLADALELSNDSVYRRIRGETALTIDEIVTLCKQFKLSFDAINNGTGTQGVVTFEYAVLKKDQSYFLSYLKALLRDISTVNKSSSRKITYACEDLPVFYNFKYPELAAFKMFYWMNAIMNVPFLHGQKFDTTIISDEMKEIGQEISRHYSNVPSVEIWTDSTILGVLKQIEYFWDSGKFKSLDDALVVVDSLRHAMEDLEKQAVQEYKEGIGGEEEKEGNFTMYASEMEITNNCVLIDIGENRRVYLGHQSFNTIITSNLVYAKETEDWLDVMIKKATLISGVAEKHRYQFFKKVFMNITKLENKLKQES